MDKQTKVEISAGAFLWSAVLLMILPLQWVFAIVFAGAIHELCHIAVICLTGGEIRRMKIGFRGALIETGEMPPWQELLCALAGLAGSAGLLLLARWFPRVAVCAAVHCLYNLLPLLPFDGGRVLKSLMILLFPHDTGMRILYYSQRLFGVAILIFCFILAFKYGWVILLFGIVFHKNCRDEKLLANRPFWRYNRRTKAKGYHYDRIKAEDSP